MNLPAPVRVLLLLAAAAAALEAGTAAEAGAQIAAAGLNPEECYRVRDLSLYKEDVRFYFTEGFLIFGKPAGEAPVSAVFVATVQGGDAEVLALPPSRSERQSLAGFTGSPNLDEHFQAAVLLFTDNTYRDLVAQIRDNPSNKRMPEMGLALAPEWDTVVANLRNSFESRLALDLLSGRREEQGVFFAAIRGLKLGNLDVVYDLRSRQQITIGQIAPRGNVTFFDVWTTFESRSARNGQRPSPGAEFTLSDFRIDATLAPPDLRLQVVTRAKLKASRALAVAPFDLSRRMRVTGASIDGQPAEIFERESMRSNLIHDHGNYLFLVVPPKPLEPGREYEIEFKHEGSVIADAGNRVYSVGSRANWYPTRGLQFAVFDATFRYPAALNLVSAGEVVSDVTEGEQRITRWRTGAPIRMLGFNLGVYERAKITRGRETIEVCANQSLERALQPKPAPTVRVESGPPIIRPAPGRGRVPPAVIDFPEPAPAISPVARLKELAADIAAALEFMAARFGPPPLANLTVSPVPGAFGQGFPGMIYLSTLSYLRPSDRSAVRLSGVHQLFFSELLWAHEVAHQWWGNVIASSGYQHDWLLEALANYSALMYLEKHKGARALESVLNEYREDLLRKKDNGRTVESAGPIALGYRLETSQTPEAWRIISYEKGSWILHMLRRLMGDARFDAFLGELRRRFEWKTLDMESFRSTAAEFLPPKSPDPKLESFFDQWVYSTGVPTLHLKYALTGKPPAQKLTVTVEQSGVDEDFIALVPVEIQFGRLKPVTRLVRTSSEPAVFTIPASQPPTRVTLDPAGAVLAVKK